MATTTLGAHSSRLLHQEHDRVAIPESVPELGVRAGDEGIIRKLDFHNNTVFAFVMIRYSTGQLRGWMVMEIKPQVRVVSYTTATTV